jgi:hypothetical protein
MWPSLRPTQRLNIAAVINPQSATTVQTSGWVAVNQYNNFLATIIVGAISSTGTVDAKLQQATDSSGTGAKDITGKAITQLTQAGSKSNTQVNINLKQDELDAQNGFNYIQLSITPATAAALITGIVFGVDPVYGPADTLAPASVQANL